MRLYLNGEDSIFLVRASRNDLRTFAATLFTPVFILVSFWIVGRPSEPGDTDLLAFIFPAIIGLTVMLGGQTVAMRIVNWREQGLFQRLAATPAPLGQLVPGVGAAQAAVSVLQALSVMLFGVLALGLVVNAVGAVMAVIVLALGVAAFIAYGMLIASLANKADLASAAFMFTLLPMFFLGGGFPSSLLPPFLQTLSPYLPTAMLNSLLGLLLASGALPAVAWQSIASLLAVTLLFGALAAWRFRWE